MITFLTDDVIVNAADYGARCFLAKTTPAAQYWIGSRQDVLQEGRLLALEFLQSFGNPRYLNPYLITRRVYFDLIDLVRSRSSYRNAGYPAIIEYDDTKNGTQSHAFEAVDLNDLFSVLVGLLTPLEVEVFNLLKAGRNYSQIARQIGLSRAAICKRAKHIRQKLQKLL